jgi:chorismate mutase
MPTRGIRGATTCDENTREAILAATDELLRQLIAENDLDPAEVASAILTTTPDLNAEFPALAARRLGWTEVPLLCGHEMAVPGGLKSCLRILIHYNTEKAAAEMKDVYIRGAKDLKQRTLAAVEEPTRAGG